MKKETRIFHEFYIDLNDCILANEIGFDKIKN